MSTLYLLKYNNYFNRTIKRQSSIQGYLSNCAYYRKIDDINFFYNDQVNTTQTINWNNTPIQEAECDYLLVDNEHYGLSRWFIIENKWNRKGQQLLTLRRDLVVDYFDDFIDMPFFAEKGCLSNYSATTIPVISNSENVIVSQILQSRTQLVPTSNTGNAIVGYMDRTFEGGALAPYIDTIYVDTDEQLPFYTYMNQPVYSDVKYYYQFGVKNVDSQSASASGWNVWASISNNGRADNSGTIVIPNFSVLEINPIYRTTLTDSLLRSNVITQLNGSSGGAAGLYEFSHEIINDLGYEAILPYIGRKVVKGNNIYTVEWEDSNPSAEYININQGAADILWSTMQGLVSGLGLLSTYPYITDPANRGAVTNAMLVTLNGISLRAYAKSYKVKLTLDANLNILLKLANGSDRVHTTQPYDIFYMPYSDTALKISSIISARYYASGILYDIQRLPYKPDTTGATSTTYTLDGGSTPFYWLKNTDNTLTSTSYTISYSGVLNAKVGCQCDMLRVVSPNNANAWDFNPAQNGGVTSWSIRMTCKPYTPYIHIKPDFKWMYGSTWTEDPRGLICGGSFSLPLVSDKWAQYQLNNKAYYDSFNRDIENLSTIQDAQRTNEKWQIAVGVGQAAVTGAGIGGFISGNNPAAIAGVGLASAVGSTVLGIADYQMNEKLRNEAIDYKKDQFGFNCQNMIASPRTLARTDSFDLDWNTYAYVEYYSASDAEKENLRHKLKWNGWTLNYGIHPNNTVLYTDGLKTLLNIAVSGQSQYIKGQLSRTEGYNDTHIFNELANELYKGIYWEGGVVS